MARDQDKRQRTGRVSNIQLAPGGDFATETKSERATRRRALRQEPGRFASKGEVVRFRELQGLRSDLEEKIAGIRRLAVNRPFGTLGVAGMDITIAKRGARGPIKRAEAALKRAQEATDRRRRRRPNRDQRLEPRR